jgi:S-formylglutathione hydrolase FrmB
MWWIRAACVAGLSFAAVSGGGVVVARHLVPPNAEVAAPSCGAGVDGVLAVADRSAPGGRRTVRVHRPAGPDRADIPVLYLLHGYPADPAALAGGTLLPILDAQMCRTGQPFVVAIPDGRAGNLDTEWGDDARGRFALETFVTRQAVALVEGALRRAPALRVIGGFSMGGYGAAALALRHPDEYRQVAAFGGYYRIDDPDRVFGNQPSAHAPDRLLDAATGQRYFLVEGRDEHTPLQVGSIRGEADRMAALLRSRAVAVAVTHPPGGHGNDAWYPQLGAMVDFLDAGFSGAGAPLGSAPR